MARKSNVRSPAAFAISILALAGCQTGAEYEAGQQAAIGNALASYQGRTVADFITEQNAFRLVDGYDAEPGRRMFVFETSPVSVTTTLPAYTPAPRTYNNQAVGAGFNNVASSIGTIPAVSRSTVQVCRVSVTAQHDGPGTTASDWTVMRVSHGDHC